MHLPQRPLVMQDSHGPPVALLDKVLNCIPTWIENLLNMGGWLMLVKLVLLSIPVYQAIAMPLPLCLLAAVEKYIRVFL